MHGTFFRGVVLGSVTAALVLGVSAALAGTGVGGIFNLGKSNAVNATSSLSGTTAGAQLSVKNSLGPAAAFQGGSNSPPFTVGSTRPVVNLNADLLDGVDSTLFYRLRTRAAANALTTVDTGNTVGAYTSVTIGADGLPVASYSDVLNDHLKVAHCANAACSSGTTTTTVDSSSGVGRYTSIAIGTDGLPLISYYDNPNGDLKVLHCGNISCSSGNTKTTVESAGDVGQYSSVTIGSEGLPLISYYDSINGELLVAHCGNVSCSSGNALTTVDFGNDVGKYSSVTIGTDGLPVISYYDSTNDVLKVAHCGNRSCSSGNTVHAVVAGTGEYTSVTIGADGLPLISSYATGSSGIFLSHCNDVKCTSTHTQSLVPASAEYTSVTIGTDGLPLVAYSDDTTGYLSVAHCGTVDCATGTVTTATVDSSGQDRYPSVTIGADGSPLITYYDAANRHLKVAHCANAFCVSYFRRR